MTGGFVLLICCSAQAIRHRAFVSQRSFKPFLVIKFNIIMYGSAQFFEIFPLSRINKLGFKLGEEAFSHCIVIAAAVFGHTPRVTISSQHIDICIRTIEPSPVRMNYRVHIGMLEVRMIKRLKYGYKISFIRYAITDNLAVEHIHND